MLNEKQKRFVAEYLKDLNATQAAIRAGYSKKTAGVQGYALLKNPHIAKAVKAAQLERAKRLSLDGDAVLAEIALVASQPDVTEANKIRALEMLAKHLGLSGFTNRVEHEVRVMPAFDLTRLTPAELVTFRELADRCRVVPTVQGVARELE